MARNHPTKRPQSVSIERRTQALYQGPTPPAAEIARLHDVNPDYADRVLALAEREATSRQRREYDYDVRLTRLGMWLGSGLALGFLAAATYLVSIDKDIQAVAFVIVSAIQMVASLLRQARKDRRIASGGQT